MAGRAGYFNFFFSFGINFLIDKFLYFLRIDLLTSPTEDIEKILAAFARVTVSGKSDFASAIQVAYLALKHRKNKNGVQRIVVFVGSPLTEEVKQLEKIGKDLRKNQVAVDVISIGELEDNQERLKKFIEAVNKDDNSHLITVPPGVAPCDAILSSPLMSAFGGADGVGIGGGGGGVSNFDDYGGIDPSLDPELAMVMRASAEEARVAEETRARAAAEANGGAVTGGSEIARYSSCPRLWPV